MYRPMSRLLFALLTCVVLLSSSCSKRRTGPNVIDPDAPQEFTVTESGLKYRILRKGDGDRPGEDSEVTVDYTGWLDNQSVFDSSYARDQPTTFKLAGVITGWTEGLQLVREGGMIELEIPPDLGYGENGSPPAIPPNATLHFKVELHEIE